jgi:glucose-6-phosphate 1-dehydrogenase
VSQTESKRVTHIPSDALVFFGATGDLAHKKIFPALQKLAKRGKLEVPVIGVAKSGWNLQQLQARAKDSVETYDGLDQEGFSKLIARPRRTFFALITSSARMPFRGLAHRRSCTG